MKKKIKDELNEDYGIFDEIMKDAPKESLLFVDRASEITAQIWKMMDERGLKQKDLAVAMKKSEPEISKLLSGTHNYTLRTLTHIECVLGANIFYTQAGRNLENKRLGRVEHTMYSSKNIDPAPGGGNYDNATPEGQENFAMAS